MDAMMSRTSCGVIDPAGCPSRNSFSRSLSVLTVPVVSLIVEASSGNGRSLMRRSRRRRGCARFVVGGFLRLKFRLQLDDLGPQRHGLAGPIEKRGAISAWTSGLAF